MDGLNGISAEINSKVAEALSQEIVGYQQKLVIYSETYLSQLEAIMSKIDTQEKMTAKREQAQKAANKLYQIVSQINNFEQMRLIGSSIPISKKSLDNFKKQQGFISKEQRQIYKEAFEASKQMREAIKNLNSASDEILRNHYLHNKRNRVNEYLQQGVILSEKYQSSILKELDSSYSSQIVFQIQGQIFMITNIDIAAEKLIKGDISATSKGGAVKGRFNFSKSLTSIENNVLQNQYGITRLDNSLLENNPAKEIMDLFLQEADGQTRYGTKFGDYRISRGEQGKYFIDWIYEGKGYHGEIGNEGDLSEIYLAAFFKSQDLSGNALEKFIKATKVDNVSGALVGDFRREIGNEFSAKSDRASYTLINQMQTLAYQIIGLSNANVNNIKEIVNQEFQRSAKESSSGNGRNIVKEVMIKEVKKLLAENAIQII